VANLLRVHSVPLSWWWVLPTVLEPWTTGVQRQKESWSSACRKEVAQLFGCWHRENALEVGVRIKTTVWVGTAQNPCHCRESGGSSAPPQCLWEHLLAHQVPLGTKSYRSPRPWCSGASHTIAGRAGKGTGLTSHCVWCNHGPLEAQMLLCLGSWGLLWCSCGHQPAQLGKLAQQKATCLSLSRLDFRWISALNCPWQPWGGWSWFQGGGLYGSKAGCCFWQAVPAPGLPSLKVLGWKIALEKNRCASGSDGR